MNNTTPGTRHDVISGDNTYGYLIEEIRDGKYIVFAGFTVHADGSEEYVGTHNGRHEMTCSVIDTWNKGPLRRRPGDE